MSTATKQPPGFGNGNAPSSSVTNMARMTCDQWIEDVKRALTDMNDSRTPYSHRILEREYRRLMNLKHRLATKESRP